MDRSVDSIGSCSLDVEADSSDISDMSGSLNFPTPISVRDITKDFTANIRERCSAHSNPNATFSDTGKKDVCMVIKQPTGGVREMNALSTVTLVANTEKKPSYLNLACCVNGYSNLTTYDSKVRQDINKSREVSPIRPSSSSIQFCKKSNSLAPPTLVNVPTVSTYEKGRNVVEANNNKSNFNNGKIESCASVQDESHGTSFIQQRVERLYGRGALAQGFYSPKKVAHKVRTPENTHKTELSQKFQEMSSNRDYSDFKKHINSNGSLSPQQVQSSSNIPCNNDETIELPVFRHLSQEFRAQLPVISPKRNVSRGFPEKPKNTIMSEKENSVIIDEVDHKPLPNVLGGVTTNSSDLQIPSSEKDMQSKSNGATGCSIDVNQGHSIEKDGNYFLDLLKKEQIRLISLATEAEKYIDMLSGNPEATEDVLGLLRSASGKARLLASQKMKQFEGLCHKNLSCSPNDPFPTTADDLQGFWDMVHLQVDNVDSIFSEVEALKINNWKRPSNQNKANATLKQKQQSIPKAVSSRKKTNLMNGSQETSASNMSSAAKKRELQRKQLLEMKRKNRIAMATVANPVATKSDQSNSIEIFVSESNNLPATN